MKKKVVSILLAAAVLAGTAACGNQPGSKTDGNAGGKTDEQTGDDKNTEDAGSDISLDGDEGKVINIYSWNNEFSQRLQEVYPEVEETSTDGTITYLKDGTEIHWIINPNQDGVY